MASQTTPSTYTLTPDENHLLTLWQERVATQNFSAGIAGTRTIKVMGRAGDAPVAIPRITSLAALDTLAPEEQFAFEYADRLVQAFRSRGRAVFSAGELISRFDPADQNDLLVLSPLAGG
jgi:hypothetical protein